MKILSIFAACMLVPTQVMAVEAHQTSHWVQHELTESFMRTLTKDQCMGKTIASLKTGCTSDSCLKTLAGISGDCTTWATGENLEFCSTFDRRYTAKYCATNELDARSCTFLLIGKSTVCKIHVNNGDVNKRDQQTISGQQ